VAHAGQYDFAGTLAGFVGVVMIMFSEGGSGMSTEDRKALVHRLVAEVYNEGRLAVLDELHEPRAAARARAWITPFRASFSDLELEIVQLVAEVDTVVGRFACSGTDSGAWLGHPPTHRRFHRVAEVYFFTFTGNRISSTWGLEDTHRRLHQLGLDQPPPDRRLG
jgi:predicted ester cyclase